MAEVGMVDLEVVEQIAEMVGQMAQTVDLVIKQKGVLAKVLQQLALLIINVMAEEEVPLEEFGGVDLTAQEMVATALVLTQPLIPAAEVVVAGQVFPMVAQAALV